MEPKEKAQKLYLKMSSHPYDNAKQCALVAVDEIIEALEYNEWQNKDWLGYYDEVKQEIEKI